MKNKASIVIMFILLLANFGCSTNLHNPEGIPDYTKGDIQLFIPKYYNEKTKCYYSSKTNARIKTDSDITIVNSFAGGEDARIHILLILKPNKLFAFGGTKGLALFQYDEEQKKWEPVPYRFAESSSEWENGGMVEEDQYYLNIGKKKCHFLPETPITIYPQTKKMVDGTYRLYVWGYEFDRNDLFFTEYIGDYVEFTVGQEE